MDSKKFYITTSIPYASRKPHIGNTYEIILTDAIARFKKMQNFDVCFCTGADEHGQKIEELAKKSGVSPAKYSAEISNIIKNIWELMDCSYDVFIKTTDVNHVEAVQQIFKKLYNNGDIYKGAYEGWYCVACESFWTNSQVGEGRCPECQREVQKTKEEAYFLKVDRYTDRLIQHINENKNFIVPNFYAEEIMNNFLKPGLQDFCISRSSFSWGVKIDFDPEYVVYVWLDALINYITALGFNLNTPSEKFNRFWPADLHVVGKDILRFHAIIWPIILMMLGLPLPKQILVHQWLLYKSGKMSKTTGNVVYADDLSRFFSVDAIRFYVLKAMPMSHDGSISYESIISTCNTDLANNIGNLTKRVCDMIYKYCDGVIPNSEYVKDEYDVGGVTLGAFKKYCECMEGYDLSEAIMQILNLARYCNKYVDETMPWALAKDENSKSALNRILYNLAEAIRFISTMLFPIAPSTAKNILKQVGAENFSFESLNSFGGLQPGVAIKKPEVLFSRIDASKKLEEIYNFNS